MSKESRVLTLSQELSGRWTIPILLALDRSGGRFTPLRNTLQIAPTRLSDNLRQMADAGLLQHLSPAERRHPLLPEYRLTDKGKLYREAAQAIRRADDSIGHGELSGKAWSMPVLLAVRFEHVRFQDIRRALHPVTPRMLSMRIEELHAEQLIGKVLVDHPRPAFTFELTRITDRPVETMSSDLLSLV